MNECNDPDHGAINAERSESRGLRKAWIELDDKRQELERELTAVTEQRDRLLEQQEQWRLSSVCRELTEQRDRLAEALERILNYQGRFAEEEPESIATEALQSLTQSPNNA